MAINTTNFSESLLPGINYWYGAGYNQYPEEYSKIFKVKKSTRRSEYTHSLTGFGEFTEKAQGASIDYDESKEGYKSTFTNISYAKGFKVTHEMIMDNLYGIVEKMSSALGRSARGSIETTAANILNNGFNSAFTGSDGKELFATDHPLLYGGTFQNEPTDSVDLCLDSLEQAEIDIAGYVDDRGLKVAARPKLLVVAKENKWTAKTLLQSGKDPESANNAINPASGMMPFMVNHWLTDPDAWFVITDIEGLLFWWRERPRFTQDNDTDSFDKKMLGYYRCVVGWDDPKCAYASSGA